MVDRVRVVGRWLTPKKGQSGRADLTGTEFEWRRSQNGLSGDGFLVQTVEKVTDLDNNGNPIDRYISGRISTAGLVSPIYGFFEARLDTLPVEGMQSAWWLWAENGLWNYDWNRNGVLSFLFSLLTECLIQIM